MPKDVGNSDRDLRQDRGSVAGSPKAAKMEQFGRFFLFES
jgi:hypothetical protein